MMNIPSECRTASIDPDHAMILSHDANPKPDGIFGKDRARRGPLQLARRQLIQSSLHSNVGMPKARHLSRATLFDLLQATAGEDRTAHAGAFNGPRGVRLLSPVVGAHSAFLLARS